MKSLNNYLTEGGLIRRGMKLGFQLKFDRENLHSGVVVEFNGKELAVIVNTTDTDVSNIPILKSALESMNAREAILALRLRDGFRGRTIKDISPKKDFLLYIASNGGVQDKMVWYWSEDLKDNIDVDKPDDITAIYNTSLDVTDAKNLESSAIYDAIKNTTCISLRRHTSLR